MKIEKLHGLDLFSGIGGFAFALRRYIKTLCYCENDRYAQAVLLSRMADGQIDRAPIWDDVQTLQPESLPEIDIICAGFPCQDISITGTNKGLEGKRSRLFFEIIRIARLLRPKILFLENVPALTIRGLERVSLELTALGYDIRWTIVSAAEVNAIHYRERIWILGHANGIYGDIPISAKKNKAPISIWNGITRHDSKPSERFLEPKLCRTSDGISDGMDFSNGSNANGLQLREEYWKENRRHAVGQRQIFLDCIGEERAFTEASERIAKPEVDRAGDGIPYKMDRHRGLGNSICPQAARKAFEKLMGIQ